MEPSDSSSGSQPESTDQTKESRESTSDSEQEIPIRTKESSKASILNRPESPRQSKETRECFSDPNGDRIEQAMESSTSSSEFDRESPMEEPNIELYSEEFDTSFGPETYAEELNSSSGSEEEKQRHHELFVLPPKEFQMSIPYVDWEKLITPNKTRLNSGWANVFRRYFRESNPYCQINAKDSHVAKKGSRKSRTSYMTAGMCCKFKGCSKYKFVVEDKPVDTSNISVSVIQLDDYHHDANEVHRANISGEERENLKKEAENVAPKILANQKLSEKEESVLKEGNFDEAPSADVIKTATKELRAKNDTDKDDLIDVFNKVKLLNLREDLKGTHISGFVQKMQLYPIGVITMTEKQLYLTRELMKKYDVAFFYLDATGSIVRKPKHVTKPIYFYPLLLKFPDSDIPAIPIAEYYSDDHSVPGIDYFLDFVQYRLHRYIKPKRHIPQKIEIDFSKALMQSVCRAFNRMDLMRYINLMYKAITSDDQTLTNITIIHICCAHVLKFMIDFLSRLCRKEYRKKEFATIFFSKLQCCSTLDEADFLIYHGNIIFGNSHVTRDYKTSLAALATKINVDEIIPNEDVSLNDFELLDLEEKKTQRELSSFTKHFDTIIHDSSRKITILPPETILKKNPLYIPEFMPHMQDYLLAYFPLWSGVCLAKIPYFASKGIFRDTNSVSETYMRNVKHERHLKKTNQKMGRVIDQSLEHILGIVAQIRFNRKTSRQLENERKKIEKERKEREKAQKDQEMERKERENEEKDRDLEVDDVKSKYEEEENFKSEDPEDYSKEKVDEETGQESPRDEVPKVGDKRKASEDDPKDLWQKRTRPRKKTVFHDADDNCPDNGDQGIGQKSASDKIHKVANKRKASNLRDKDPKEMWQRRFGRRIRKGFHNRSLSACTQRIFRIIGEDIPKRKVPPRAKKANFGKKKSPDQRMSTSTAHWKVAITDDEQNIVENKSTDRKTRCTKNNTFLVIDLEKSENSDSDPLRKPFQATVQLESGPNSIPKYGPTDRDNLTCFTHNSTFEVIDLENIEQLEALPKSKRKNEPPAAKRKVKQKVSCLTAAQKICNYTTGTQVPSLTEWSGVQKVVHGYNIDTNMLSCLLPSKDHASYLGDEIVNCFMSIQAANASEINLSIVNIQSEWYTRLTSETVRYSRQWSRVLNIFNYDIALIPVCLSDHWVLVLIEKKNKEVWFLDSHSEYHDDEYARIPLTRILSNLTQSYQSQFGKPFNVTEWKLYYPHDIPQQNNGFDCGVFICMYAYILCNGKYLDLDAINTDYARRFIGDTILNCNIVANTKADQQRRCIVESDLMFEESAFTLPRIHKRKSHLQTMKRFANLYHTLFKATRHLCGMGRACMKPKEDMVFCHGCNEWYHRRCLGRISHGPLPDRYFCPQCDETAAK